MGGVNFFLVKIQSQQRVTWNVPLFAFRTLYNYVLYSKDIKYNINEMESDTLSGLLEAVKHPSVNLTENANFCIFGGGGGGGGYKWHLEFWTSTLTFWSPTWLGTSQCSFPEGGGGGGGVKWHLCHIRGFHKLSANQEWQYCHLSNCQIYWTTKVDLFNLEMHSSYAQWYKILHLLILYS